MDFEFKRSMSFNGLAQISLGLNTLKSATNRLMTANLSVCSIKGLSLGSKDYTKELKTVECRSFLDQTS